MRRSRLTESPILKGIKAVEAGRQVVDARQEHAISDATYCNGKAKYGAWQHGVVRYHASQGPGRGEQTPQADVRRAYAHELLWRPVLYLRRTHR